MARKFAKNIRAKVPKHYGSLPPEREQETLLAMSKFLTEMRKTLDDLIVDWRRWHDPEDDEAQNLLDHLSKASMALLRDFHRAMSVWEALMISGAEDSPLLDKVSDQLDYLNNRLQNIEEPEVEAILGAAWEDLDENLRDSTTRPDDWWYLAYGGPAHAAHERIRIRAERDLAELREMFRVKKR
jgi:hypothetical protein